jgi:hypothetical protein
MRSTCLLVLLALPAAGAEPARIIDVTDKPPGLIERENEWVKWTERLQPLQQASKCGTPEASCTVIRLIVWNPGETFLKCGGTIKFNQPNPRAVGDASSDNVLVPPKSEAIVALAMSPGGLPFTRDSQCIPAETPAPPPPSASPPSTAIVDCRYSFTKPPDILAFYPPAALTDERQGRVYMQFTLAEAEGAPTDIVMYQSSSHADIDVAGPKVLASARFKTNCPGHRFRAAIKFAVN